MKLIDNTKQLQGKIILLVTMMLTINIGFILPGLPGSLDVASQSACDWTMYGKSSDGSRIVSDCIPDIDKLEEKWSLQGFQTSPIVWGDRLYYSSGQYLYCVDAKSGANIWRSENANHFGYTPAFEDGMIYTHYYSIRGNMRHINCFDALTGKEIWSYQTKSADWLLKVYQGKLYYADKDALNCMDAKNRRILWEYKRPNIGDFYIVNGKVFIKPLVCLDADTGNIIWDSKKKYSGEFCFGDGSIYAMTYSGSGEHFLSCISVTTGETVWELKIGDFGDFFYYKISFLNGNVFVKTIKTDDNTKNIIMCFNAQGKGKVWEKNFGNDSLGDLTFLDGTIVAGADTGKLFFIDTKDGKIIRQMDFDGSIGWEVVAAQNKIYVFASNTLHCLGEAVGATKPTGWQMSGGNSQNNRFNSDGTNTRTVGSLWTFETSAPVASSVAVANDKAVFGSNDGDVYCTNASNGKKIWNFQTGSQVQSTPAIWQGKVLAGSNDGKMYCLSLETGKKFWEYDAKASIRSSPVVAGGMVFFGTDSKSVLCLDIENGEKRWEQKTKNTISSQIAFDNGRVFVTYQEDDQEYHSGVFWTLFCFDAQTGSVVWNLELPYGTDGSPSIADGFIYLATADKNVWCIDKETGIKVWESKKEYSATTSLAVDKTRVYFGTNDKRIICLNRDNGTLCWEYESYANLSSSPAVMNGFVCFGESDGKVTCLDNVTGQRVWVVSTNGAVTSSPAVSFGKVFVGSWDGKVYCIGDIAQPEPVTNTFDWSCGEINNQHNRVLPAGTAPKTNRLKQLWEMETASYGYQRIVVGRYIFMSTNSMLIKLDALTGAAVWQKGYYWEDNSNTKLVLNAYTQGMLYCTHSDKQKVLCINSLDGKIVWEMTGKRKDEFRYIRAENDKVFLQADNLMCLDALTGKKLWEYKSDQIALIGEEKVLVSKIVKYSSELVCLDAKTGQEIWSNDDHTKFTSLVYANGKLFGLIYSEDKDPEFRTLYCIDAGTGGKDWETNIPFKSSGDPIIADGKIYLGANDYIYVLDEATGGLLDKFDYTLPEDRYGSGMLTYSDGKLYWRSVKGFLYCKDAKTGKNVFSIQDQNLRVYNNQSSSPIIIALGRIFTQVQGKLVCWGDEQSQEVCDWPMPGRTNQRNANASEPCPQAKQEVPKKVWEFDAKTGYKSSDKGNTLPIMANGCLFFYTNNGKFWSVSQETGKPNWSIDLEQEQGCYYPAVYADGKVFFTTFDPHQETFGKLQCLNATNGAKLWVFEDVGKIWGSPVFWENKVYIGSTNNKQYCLDADTGKVIWEYECSREVQGTPAIVDGKIYFGSSDNKFQCLDATTGKVIWTFATGDTCGGTVSLANGKVYFASNDFWLYCLDAQTGAFIWKYYGSPPIHQAPTIVTNRLYFIDRNYLTCLDANTKEEFWRVDDGGSYSSPTVVRNRVYLGIEDGNLICFNAYTGETIWNLEEIYIIRSSVIWQDGKLYFGTLDGKVCCYEDVK